MPFKRYWTRMSAVLLNTRVLALSSKKHVDECDIYTALIKTAMHIVAVHFMGIIHIFFFNFLGSMTIFYTSLRTILFLIPGVSQKANLNNNKCTFPL